jgi:hypothetical protein
MRKSNLVDATPTRIDLHGYQGDDLLLRIGVYDGDGALIDLTGAIPSAQIRQTADDPVVLADFLALISTTDKNVIELRLTAADTALLPTDIELVWDVEYEDVNGLTTTVLAGCACFEAEVTRP